MKRDAVWGECVTGEAFGRRGPGERWGNDRGGQPPRRTPPGCAAGCVDRKKTKHKRNANTSPQRHRPPVSQRDGGMFRKRGPTPRQHIARRGRRGFTPHNTNSPSTVCGGGHACHRGRADGRRARCGEETAKPRPGGRRGAGVAAAASHTPARAPARTGTLPRRANLTPKTTAVGGAWTAVVQRPLRRGQAPIWRVAVCWEKRCRTHPTDGAWRSGGGGAECGGGRVPAPPHHAASPAHALAVRPTVNGQSACTLVTRRPSVCGRKRPWLGVRLAAASPQWCAVPVWQRPPIITVDRAAYKTRTGPV